MFCILNVSYIFQDIVNGIVTKRLGRFFEFPTLQHMSDLLLTICSMWVYYWVSSEIDAGVNDDKEATELKKVQIIASNFQRNAEYPFQWLFSIIVICLIFRLS